MRRNDQLGPPVAQAEEIAMTPDTPTDQAPDSDDHELLIDGQEEVFSRTEVERGLIEHHTLEENKTAP
jgi:hypothetical protein